MSDEKHGDIRGQESMDDYPLHCNDYPGSCFLGFEIGSIDEEARGSIFCPKTD